MRIGSAEVARKAVEYVEAAEAHKAYDRKRPPGAAHDPKYAQASLRCYKALVEVVEEYQCP